MDVSFQLYSARDLAPWPEVFAMLRAEGYTQAEGFGGVYDDPHATRAALDQAGLGMPSGHFFPISNFEDGLEASLAAARILGMERVFCPAPEDDLQAGGDARAWIAFAKRLEDVCKKVNDAGLRFGWHNHDWEFLSLPGGSVAMELVLEHAPSIDWEVDVAWIVRGGADPIAWINNHAGRITTAHVKDIAPEGECVDEDGWADVGHGTMDWPAIMTALRAAEVDLFVMEHDKPSDVKRFSRRSIAAFRNL